MAFTRRPQERSSPSLGYRISSDRQPGIEQANIRPTVRGFQGFDTSETARENYISRTGGGYPNRPQLSKRYNPEPYRYNPEPYRPDQDVIPDYLLRRFGKDPRITPKGMRVGPRHWQVDKDMFEDMFIPNRQIGRGIGSLMPYEETAVDPSDWRILQQIIKAGGNPDDYTQTAGIMGAMPEERQMAELTQDQMNMMGNPLNTPDFGVSKEDLWNRTKDMEDQGFFGWGAQEPTTREEFEDYYRQLQVGTAGNWVT